MVLVLLLALSAAAETTTQSYQIPVEGSNPITIIEGEPLWKRPQNKVFEHRALKFYTTDRNTTPDKDEEDQDKNSRLHQFLNKYAENVRKTSKEPEEEDQSSESSFISDPEKSKSWNLLHYQNHQHPHDEKKGWVSMEPIPWSVSKISKWNSNYKPKKPWENDYGSEETRPYKPSYHENNYYDERPIPEPLPFKRPSASYGQKVHVSYEPHKPNCDNRNHNHHRYNSHHEEASDELIIDNSPPNFPSYDSNRRRGTEMEPHPESHPFSGEGDWVLLSTTKGYKYPQQRQRSLQINPESIGTHRTVRLTVLPPLKNSKVNMTTSHGGLLQVESSFETVEQAQKQYTKKQQQPKKKPVRKNATKSVTRRVVTPTATVTTRRHSSPDSSAVLAAVGAGMIPATMAMLVPMAMGGRKKRDTHNLHLY